MLRWEIGTAGLCCNLLQACETHRSCGLVDVAVPGLPPSPSFLAAPATTELIQQVSDVFVSSVM